ARATRSWRSLAGNAGPGPVDPGRSRPPESGGPGYDVGRARPATQVADERHLTPSTLMRSWALERLAQESSGESLLAVVRKAVRATSYSQAWLLELDLLSQVLFERRSNMAGRAGAEPC